MVGPDMCGPPLHRGGEAPGDLLPLRAAVDRAPVLVPDVVFLRPPKMHAKYDTMSVCAAVVATWLARSDKGRRDVVMST